jgi:VanZ family protein
MATSAFATLFAAASWFIGDMGVAGLSDNAVRCVAHFTVYGTLATLVARSLWNMHLLAWLIVTLAATAEEIHQLFIQYRFASAGDWAINLAGITVFLVISARAMPVGNSECPMPNE